MRPIATEVVWGAEKGEGGTLGVEMFTRAASLLQVAQSRTGAWLLQQGLRDHTPHGCLRPFVPLSVPPAASNWFKNCFKLTSDRRNRQGKGLTVNISPQILCSEAADRGTRPHVRPTRGKRQKITHVPESLLQARGFINAPSLGKASVGDSALFDTREPNQKTQIRGKSAFAIHCHPPEAEL